MTEEISMEISDMTLLLSGDASGGGESYGDGVAAGGYISDECGKRAQIDCWGDGIFYGYGEDTNAPDMLGVLLGDDYTVTNYAQYGETAEAVAFRQGAICAAVKPFTVASDVNDSAEISYIAPDGDDLSTMSDDGVYRGNTYVYIDGEKFRFIKTHGGAGKIYPTDPEQVNKAFTSESYMYAEGGGVNHTLIVCVGKSGWADTSPETLCDVIESMVRKNGNNNYIVVSPPMGSAESMKATERALGARFGRRFFNGRKFVSAYGLSENSLTATDDDTSAMKSGEIPPTLLNSSGYGNEYFNKALSRGIYAFGKSLSLW